MGLSQATLDAIAAAVAQAVAQAIAPATSSTAAPAARTFATKAERAAGNGFPCTASPACARTDLRTAASGASHDPKAPHWHTPKA